jgi:hypothetical protein
VRRGIWVGMMVRIRKSRTTTAMTMVMMMRMMMRMMRIMMMMMMTMMMMIIIIMMMMMRMIIMMIPVVVSGAVPGLGAGAARRVPPHNTPLTVQPRRPQPPASRLDRSRRLARPPRLGPGLPASKTTTRAVEVRQARGGIRGKGVKPKGCGIATPVEISRG